MNLYRVKIKPLSSWRTPWQSDTLAGLLCWTCVRRDGDQQLQSEIIQPALDGQPPFVVSDAYPGDWLPVPILLRLDQEWPAEEWEQFPDLKKRVRKAKWITREGFEAIQQGDLPSIPTLVRDGGIRQLGELHNSIDRMSNMTSPGGQLFVTDTQYLGGEAEWLSVYVRVEDSYADRFLELLTELSQSGFGADASVGKGEFELASDLEPADWLDQVAQPNAMITLSTFQPAQDDPTTGYWETFVKYGKVGPDFGLENVFKRPMVLFRPGAFFSTTQMRPFLGRAVPMDQLLAGDVVNELSRNGKCVVHLAFALTVPMTAS